MLEKLRKNKRACIIVILGLFLVIAIILVCVVGNKESGFFGDSNKKTEKETVGEFNGEKLEVTEDDEEETEIDMSDFLENSDASDDTNEIQKESSNSNNNSGNSNSSNNNSNSNSSENNSNGSGSGNSSGENGGNSSQPGNPETGDENSGNNGGMSGEDSPQDSTNFGTFF